MPAIKSTSLRDLKARVNLLEVVSRVVTVRKVGARFRALCPFHQEKTPSFYINPDKGLYHCFGCGKSGDLIAFVRETEQLSFTEAVETLAKRFGVTLEYEAGSGPSREERSLRQELFELHELAAEHFHQAFKGPGAGGEFMRTYWTEKRRFPPELADEFKIGVADENGSDLAAVLMRKKFSEEALRQCGLFFAPRDGGPILLGTLRHRFRGRLMIPIRDHQGRVVAFTARQTDLTPADDPAREAKYVNSPETPIFTKGNLLFNLDRARSHVGEDRPFVLVEGQLDALRCWHVGLKTAVAPQGTAITETQLALLRRYHEQVECFFDSDSAGQKAALRFLPLALKAGLEVRFLTLAGAEKVDPDLLFLERGLPAYDELRRSALSMMGFMQRYILPDPRSATPEATARAIQQIYEVIAATDSEVLQKQLLSEIAPAIGALRVMPDVFERDFLRFTRSRNRLIPPSSVVPGPGNLPAAATVRPPEHDLLLLCLHYEQFGKPLAHELLPRDWIDATHPAGSILRRFLTEFEHDAWPGRDHLDELLGTPEEKTLVAALLFEPPDIDDPRKVVNEGLRRLQSRALEPRLRQIELEIAAKQTDVDADLLPLLKSRSELQRQLRQPPVLAERV
ncbi:MAG: DNA primase [Opitutaceae bacterium]|jgi:DNA primase